MTKKSKSFDQQDKKRLLAIAKEILIAFADGAVKRGDKVSSIAANTLGMSFFAGFFVNFTETFVDERRKFTTLAAKMLKAKAAHENTIDNFCLKAGQEYLQQLAVATDGVQVSVEGVAQGLVDKVLDEAGREYTYIAPNFLIRHAGADIITLGRVRSMPTELAKTNTKLLLNPQIKFEVRLGLDQQLSRTEIVLNMPPSVWVVEVPATKENVEEEAKWLIDIASSLMRLSASKWAQMWPVVGKPEQHPTLTPQFTISTVTMEDDSAFAGGIKLPNVYEANHEVVGELASPSTQSRAAALFDATKGSLAQRVAHGLGWMSRGRQATDRAERHSITANSGPR